jgi:hypothetical protein
MRAQTQNQNNAPSKEEKVYFTTGVEEMENVLNVKHDDPLANDPEIYLQGLIQNVLQSELQNVLKNVKMCRQRSVFDLMLRLSEVQRMPGIETNRVMELKVINDRDSRDCTVIRSKLDLNLEIVELKRSVHAVVQTLPENERRDAERIVERLEIPNNQQTLVEVFTPERKSMFSLDVVRNASTRFKIFIGGTIVIIFLMLMQDDQFEKCETYGDGSVHCVWPRANVNSYHS